MADWDKSNEAPKEETAIEGRVKILGDFPRGKLRDRNGVKRNGKHSGLLLKTENGRIVIHLGPAAYLLHHNFQIKVGDNLEVILFQVVECQMPLVQASEVKT